VLDPPEHEGQGHRQAGQLTGLRRDDGNNQNGGGICAALEHPLGAMPDVP
jgi:hypothetical protein